MAKILIVDDDPEMVESTGQVLKAKGYDVVGASSGEEGFKKAIEFRPDLILLDVMMKSDSEGFDMARRLHDAPETNKLPVILITGIKKAKRLPFSYEPDPEWLPVKAVLEKPVEPEALLKHIAMTLGT